jgi:DNA-binding transcriptional ArsR family regulator
MMYQEVGMILDAAPTRLALKAKLFRGFSDLSRLKILEALLAEPRTVSQMVAQTGLSQSNVSNHLACLRDCGLVVARPEGRFVLYALSDERVRQVLTLGESLLADVARGVFECTHYEMPEDAEA